MKTIERNSKKIFASTLALMIVLIYFMSFIISANTENISNDNVYMSYDNELTASEVEINIYGAGSGFIKEEITVNNPKWSLINLMLAVITGVMLLVMFMGFIVSKMRYMTLGTGSYAFKEEIRHKRSMWLLCIVPATTVITLFVLVSDIRAAMVIVDEWTVYMLALAALQILTILFMSKKYEFENNFELRFMQNNDLLSGK
jgi:hypothetical protein